MVGHGLHDSSVGTEAVDLAADVDLGAEVLEYTCGESAPLEAYPDLWCGEHGDSSTHHSPRQ